MKTVILGIGNTLLSDDGVGVYIAKNLAERFADDENVTVKEGFSPGFELVDEILGYDRAIIVDAIMLSAKKPGEILRYTPSDFKDAIHLSSYHDMNFPTSLELARMMGLALPGKIVIFAVNVSDITTLRESCTDKVSKAIPLAVEMIFEEVTGGR